MTILTNLGYSLFAFEPSPMWIIIISSIIKIIGIKIQINIVRLIKFWIVIKIWVLIIIPSIRSLIIIMSLIWVIIKEIIAMVNLAISRSIISLVY